MPEENFATVFDCSFSRIDCKVFQFSSCQPVNIFGIFSESEYLKEKTYQM